MDFITYHEVITEDESNVEVVVKDLRIIQLRNRAQIVSPLTGGKVGYGVGLKSSQAWGCACSIKCLF
jgi:hypothetical protein